MFHQLKITSYAFIVALVPFLFLSSPATAIDDASSCKGWVCDIEGQFCPQGVPGAKDGSYLCKRVPHDDPPPPYIRKWVKLTPEDVDEFFQQLMDNVCR